MGWKNFNDRLALIALVAIVGLWVSQRWIQLPEGVIGATILQFGLVLQFYFRKAAKKK